MKTLTCILILAFLAAPVMAVELTMSPVGTYEAGIFDEGAAEDVSYHPQVKWLYITNGNDETIDVINISNPKKPKLLFQIPLPNPATSVAAHPTLALVAACCEGSEVTDPGTVEFFRLTGQHLGSVSVGSLPDKIAWTPDGQKVLTANEGEPTNTEYEAEYEIQGEPGAREVVFEDFTDPAGSVSIITLGSDKKLKEKIQNAQVTQVEFTDYNDKKAELLEKGVRIFAPAALLEVEVLSIEEGEEGPVIEWGDETYSDEPTVAQDLEPENMTISKDSQTAYVTMQENNAIAVIDIAEGTVTDILAMGYKDHNVIGAGLDGAKNKTIDILPWPVKGMYQPDGIAIFTAGDDSYLVVANEGDARDVEESKVEKVDLSDALTQWSLDNLGTPEEGEPPLLQDDDHLGSLKITSMFPGGLGADNELYCFGGRSFTILTLAGEIVYDSGDKFEQITAAKYPAYFNSKDDKNKLDDRSDDKGPEPESIAVGQIDGCTVAFIGLERIGGIMAFDLTDPEKPRFLDYVNRRNFDEDVSIEDEDENEWPNPAAGDLSMEGLIFISAENSPTHTPLVVAAHEVSGTTTVFEINVR